MKKGQTPYRPEALERLALDPAGAPGPGGAALRPLRRDPTAAEREDLLVHAAWRRGGAELPAAADAAAPDPFAEMFESHPLSWGGIKNFTHQKLWVVWRPSGEPGPGTLCDASLHHIVHHKRGIPMPDVVARAALQRRLEQVALRQGDRWPFCPCKYLGRFSPPPAGAAGAEAGEEDAAAAPEAPAEEAFEPDPRKWPQAAPSGRGHPPRPEEKTDRPSHETVWF